MKELLKKIIPKPLLDFYHLTLAHLGAFLYGFPSRELFVIAVTGTKGKSTTVELVAAILRAVGHKTAVVSTIRFAIGDESECNLYKMTTPGRFFLQKFLRKAANAGCTHAVIEMTSEGAAQYRHKGIALDALVFLNLAPEHLESHGGLEQYALAKLSLARHLALSRKRPRIIVANADDEYGGRFLEAEAEKRIPFSLRDAEPYQADEKSLRFVWKRGELFSVPLPGLFNLKNCLAALALVETLGIEASVSKKALEHIAPIPGRAQRIEHGQPFHVVVDYAHTPDSLKALYETYKPAEATPLEPRGVTSRKLICVLGSTGGGRDKWKRPEMGKVAERFCDTAILTNEDPYDEDPKKIMEEIAGGFSRKTPRVVLDRRQAIREALKEAQTLRQAQGDQSVPVLITGKGPDPYIMGPRGKKEPWCDAAVAEEELQKLGYENSK